MTIRDHRLKAAARDWDRAQLAGGAAGEGPGAARTRSWAAKQAARLHQRSKKHMLGNTTTTTKARQP